MNAKFEGSYNYKPLQPIHSGISVPGETTIDFSFQGHHESLDIIFEELSCGSILSKAASYSQSNLYDSKYQYNVQIPANHFHDLVMMFEYHQKRLGHYCNPDVHFKIFERVSEQITYEYDSVSNTSSVSDILLSAVRTASTNKKPLIFDQLSTIEKGIDQQQNNSKTDSYNLCKIGLFAVAAVGIIALGTDKYLETFQPR